MRPPLTLIFALFICYANAQTGSITGLVVSQGEAVPYAYCVLEEMEQEAIADEHGHFMIKDVKPGSYQLYITSLGYLPEQVQVEVPLKAKLEIELQPSPFNASTVVVTGTRTGKRRTESAVVVNVLNRETLEATGSGTLADGLCFQPGLRVETDCQTCNYTQVRMNGLGGAYTQLLIDNRPVFSSLMSLYGLEQIPASQIERVEVVRGGGSVLYGANAIAGTVNILTRMPTRNEWSASQKLSRISGEAFDRVLDAQAAIVAEDKKSALSLFAANRGRQSWDANGDGFSELPSLRNNSFGVKLHLMPSENQELKLTGWSIYEYRRGGNKEDLPAHEADQSEERTHNILVGSVDHRLTFAEGKSSLNSWLAVQHTKRQHYTGIDHSDGWGDTRSYVLSAGIQWDQRFEMLGGHQVLTLGFDHQSEDTRDEIPAYNYLIDQTTHLNALFVQSDWQINKKLTLLSGLRLNRHYLMDKPVITPRISALHRPAKNLQVRVGYARGFKAPQAFETDLHIAFAGGGVALTAFDSELQHESSSSWTGSIDYDRPSTHSIWGFTLAGFHTRLENAFILEEQGTDANGNMLLLRKNGKGLEVSGLTLETRFNYDGDFQLEGGFTIQQSKYDEEVFWSSEIPGSRSFLRTPDHYGYYTLSLFPEGPWTLNLSGVYTGPMWVPHFAGAPGVYADELVHSQPFHELNVRLNKRTAFSKSELKMDLSMGMQNLFNAYQSDFDTGPYRDSNYIYGPARPRTVWVGATLGL
ncbi:MAG: TonB-dependent receptor [Saprospiraceae bacterium]